MSLAIYLDKKNPANSHMFEYRVGETHLDFNFKRYYVGDQSEEELYKSTNPFALVILTALIGLRKGLMDLQLLELKYSLVKRLMEVKLPRAKIIRLLRFINSYLVFEKPETNIKFAERIEPITTIKNTSMGILEVLAEEAEKYARKEERKATLLSIAKKMLRRGIDFSLVNQCTGISHAQLVKLAKNK